MYPFDKADPSCKHPSVSLKTTEHENGQTGCWWECDSCKLEFHPGGGTMDTNEGATGWDINSLQHLLDEPIELANKLPCSGGKDCPHCKLLFCLKDREWFARGLYAVIRQMSVRKEKEYWECSS